MSVYAFRANNLIGDAVFNSDRIGLTTQDNGSYFYIDSNAIENRPRFLFFAQDEPNGDNVTNVSFSVQSCYITVKTDGVPNSYSTISVDKYGVCSFQPAFLAKIETENLSVNTSGSNFVSSYPNRFEATLQSNFSFDYNGLTVNSYEVENGTITRLLSTYKFTSNGSMSLSGNFGIINQNTNAGILFTCNENDCNFGFGDTGSADVMLRRDAAHVMGLSSGTQPSTFNIYDSRIDANTYTRARLGWNSSIFRIGTEASNVGAPRKIQFEIGNDAHLTVSNDGNIGVGTTAPTTKLQVSGGKTKLAASTTTTASLNIPAGDTPTNITDGDIWFDGTSLKIRINGVVRTINVT